MSLTNELLGEFYALFGDQGGDRIPGNVGISRTAANVCQEIMKETYNAPQKVDH